MSSAEDIRERFEASLRASMAEHALREHLRKGQVSTAATIARALGVQLPEHQVVRVDFARGRS